MSNLLSQLSDNLAAAAERAGQSVVQVAGHRRPAAGVVFAEDLVVAPARSIGDDIAVVRLPNGSTIEGQVLGHALSMGLAVVRVPGAGLTPGETGPEPKVGSLAIALGRTWSGGLMASVTNVAVVGGPLRTGRTSQIDRVIRISQSPHGALTGGALTDADGCIVGVLTGAAIRGTAVVIPATLAFNAAHQIVKRGGTQQGYLGVSSMLVSLPARQRGDHPAGGLLVTGIVESSPADAAGVLVGDVIVEFAGERVEDPESLITFLRGDRVGTAVTLTVVRGVKRHEVAVTIGERPHSRG